VRRKARGGVREEREAWLGVRGDFYSVESLNRPSTTLHTPTTLTSHTHTTVCCEQEEAWVRGDFYSVESLNRPSNNSSHARHTTRAT
jgi:hypothetical protein